MTTADDLRSLYVETLAEILFDAWVGWRGIRGAVWADCEQGMREDFLGHAESHLERFAAKGQLPISIEEQLAGGFQHGIHTFADITNQAYPPTYTVRRYVTDWRPTPTTEGDRK